MKNEVRRVWKRRVHAKSISIYIYFYPLITQTLWRHHVAYGKQTKLFELSTHVELYQFCFIGGRIFTSEESNLWQTTPKKLHSLRSILFVIHFFALPSLMRLYKLQNTYSFRLPLLGNFNIGSFKKSSICIFSNFVESTHVICVTHRQH